MTAGIYKITRQGTDDMYIGSSTNIEKRWTGHRWALLRGKHHSTYLQNVVDKYGIDAIAFSIIEVVDDVDLLLDREQYYIDKLLPIFNTRQEVRLSPESIEKIRNAHLGRKRSQETRDRISAALMGNTNGKHRKNREISEETREKMRQAKLGKKRQPHSEETKRKISDAQKGVPRLYRTKIRG